MVAHIEDSFTPEEENGNRFTARLLELASEGLDNEEIYQEISRFNKEACHSIFTDKLVKEWVKTVTQEVPTIREPAPPAPVTQITDAKRLREATNPLDKAIALRDVRYLYVCLRELASFSPMQYALKKEEIKKEFGKSINLVDLERAVAAERRALEEKKPDVATITFTWCSTHKNTWAYDEGKKVWRYWSGEYWQEQDEKENSIDIEATGALQDAGLSVNTGAALNLFRRLAIQYMKRAFPHQPHLVNFQNGTFDLAQKTLYPFRESDGLTYILPYSYIPTGTHSRISAFLEETIPDPYARACYIAHVGLSLIGDTDFHNFLLLIGPPRSGKSTLLVLANMVCGSLPYAFAGKHILSPELEGKRSRFTWSKQRIVCADEIPMGALRDGEENLKNMSAHGGVEMRGILQNEPSDNRWIPKIIFSSNDTPSYKDTSGAIGYRAIIIECPNGPRPENEQNKQLVRTVLAEEVSAFATTCIHYGLAVHKQGFYPRSASMKEKLYRIGIDGNLLKSFIEEGCILDPEAIIFVPQLYTAFCEYNQAVGNHNNIMHSNTMATAIYDMHIGAIPLDRKYLNGKQERRMKGIRLRSSDDPLLEEENTSASMSDPLFSQDKQDNQKGVVLGIVSYDKPASREELLSLQDNKTTKTLINSMGDDISLIQIQDIPSLYEGNWEKSCHCLANGTNQPVEPKEQQDSTRQPLSYGLSCQDGEEETTKNPRIMRTERPCRKCGSYYMVKQDDGLPICVCQQKRKEQKE